MQQTDRPPASGQPATDFPAGKKPFAYELPHDAEEVAALAGGLAYYLATAAYPHQGPCGELLQLALEYLDSLSSSAGSFLSEIALTNDRAAFQALFAECFVQMYYQVIDTWLREPETAQRVKHLLVTLSSEELLAYTQERAKEALSAVVVGITHQGPAPVAPPGHVIALARVLRLFSHGLRNELHIRLQWLHRLVQFSRFFWSRVRNTSPFWKQKSKKGSQQTSSTSERELVAHPVGFSRGLGKSVTSEQVFGPAASHWREGGATSDPRSERLAAYAVSRTHGGYMHGKRDGTFSR
jgi:hypothetical protein